ncbi:MAG: hypothetical protein F4Z22_06435 [Acidimicrobiia bacterium]|nr:hypothetical protein [Acidimicrobiia bacterium]
MSHRLEVMLTSRRPDGTWTWRAAGARQPKGVLDAGLLPAGAEVGDVLRVEAEVSVDGIAVRQVLPAKAERPAAARVEHLGGQRFTEGVTGASEPPRPPSERPDGRGGRRKRDSDGRAGGRSQRTHKDRSEQRGGRDRPPRAPRLRPASAHRDAWLATLSTAERPIAERLINEGIRAVRQGLQAESSETEGQTSGRPGETDEEALAVVEGLVTALRAADWRDRAEAARKVSDEVDLRDLRSVVAGIPQQFSDDEARALAEELRRKLAARVDREHSAWIADLGSLVRKERLVTALRVSQRPPKAGTPLPDSLAQSLHEGAGSQLNAATEDDLWVRMLEAAAQSPIRLVLVAHEPPSAPSERLLRAVRRFGERLPALRAQFAQHLEAPEEAEALEAAAGTEEPEEAAAAEAEASVAPAQAPEPAAATDEPPRPEASGEAVEHADAHEEVAEPGGEAEVS